MKSKKKLTTNGTGERRQAFEKWGVIDETGRDAAFNDPKKLMQAFIDYTIHSDSNPMEQHEVKIVRNKLVDVYTKYRRPWSLHGFCMHLGVSTNWWREFKESKTFKTFMFSSVYHNIETAVYRQKYDGAAVGFYNAAIVSRDLGLRDSTDVQVSDKRDEVASMFPFAPPKEKEEKPKKK